MAARRSAQRRDESVDSPTPAKAATPKAKARGSAASTKSRARSAAARSAAIYAAPEPSSTTRKEPARKPRSKGSKVLPLRADQPLPPAPARSAREPKFEERLERVEGGLRVLAETFRRAFDELQAATEGLRREVAGTATRADLERALTQAATRADVDEITARAIWPVATSLQQLIESAPPSQNSIRHTLKRLTDAIEAAEAVVEAAELSRAQAAEAADSEAAMNGAGATDGPDPEEIWGETNGSEAARLAEREHHRKSAARRKLERTRPGKAYANWKYRRSELE